MELNNIFAKNMYYEQCISFLKTQIFTQNKLTSDHYRQAHSPPLPTRQAIPSPSDALKKIYSPWAQTIHSQAPLLKHPRLGQAVCRQIVLQATVYFPPRIEDKTKYLNDIINLERRMHALPHRDGESYLIHAVHGDDSALAAWKLSHLEVMMVP